jgi:hypothetical protein
MNAEIPAHCLAFLECRYQHDNGAGNVAFPGFPTTNRSPTFDANEACETFGAKAEGMTG